MAKNAASEAALGTLHAKIAAVMKGALEVQDEAQQRYLEDPNAVEAPQVSAPLLSVITKFLADNSISCDPAESESVSTLADKLKNRRKRVGNVTHLHEMEDAV